MAAGARAGRDLIGSEMARDFGDSNGGVFFGKVIGYMGGRRPLYRAEYSDGNIEDLDHEQLQRAMEFAIKHVFKDCGSSSEASIDSDSSSDGKSEAAPPKKRKPKNKGGRPKKQKPKPAPPKPPAIASKPARKPACSPGDLRKFKPVIDRKTYEDEKTPPTFHLPRKETRDISNCRD